MSASLTERMQNSSGDERILKKRLGFAVYQQIKNKQSDMNAIINNRIHYDAECTIFHKAFVVMKKFIHAMEVVQERREKEKQHAWRNFKI
ncbi:hypothetical protein T01_2803 [Trichinella spiralis]|uniref:Uncharacterized protein n=1 Tax=Trichinella spiralis TaxID=6334 RepID=A0A0V1BJ76_TRISP|nr:hypothetical protein T01_2803 [Trichinella spiralis]